MRRKETKTKENKDKGTVKECEYPLCHNRGELYQCPYCERYFCRDHILAVPPSNYNLKTIIPKDMKFIKTLKKISKKHSCRPFYYSLKRHIEKREEEYFMKIFTPFRRYYIPRYRIIHHPKKPEPSKFWKKLLAMLILVFVLIGTTNIFFHIENKRQFVGFLIIYAPSSIMLVQAFWR